MYDNNYIIRDRELSIICRQLSNIILPNIIDSFSYYRQLFTVLKILKESTQTSTG